MSSYYLKAAGLKRESYPFDWIFSGPDIIQDCIRDNFSSYLDRHQYFQNPHYPGIGHLRYHAGMFNHRSPLVANNYQFYVRCVVRMRQVLFDQAPILPVFVLTRIDDYRDRKIWSKGFTQQYPLPAGEIYECSIQSLFNALSELRADSRFIKLTYETGCPSNQIEVKQIMENYSHVKVHTRGASNGVCFSDLDTNRSLIQQIQRHSLN